MSESIPDVSELADRVLAEADKHKRVVVFGSVGSGKSTLLVHLAQARPESVLVELLPLDEADAPAAGLLQAVGGLEDRTARARVLAAAPDMRAAAAAVSSALREADRTLLVRVPGSWRLISAVETDDSVRRRGQELMDGWIAGGANLVAVADAGIRGSQIGFGSAEEFSLPPHDVTLAHVAPTGWAGFEEHVASLMACVESGRRASPLAWRLAVGAVALGREPTRIAGMLRAGPALRPLVDAVAEGLRARPEVALAVRRFLEVRRPMAASAIAEVTGIHPTWLPLLTHAIGYGVDRIRVTPPVRAMLRTAISVVRSGTPADEGVESAHLALSKHFADLDGKLDPAELRGEAMLAWSEKVHHLAHAGAAGAVEWSRQHLPAPEMYWDRARYLSIVRRDFLAAADVYRACVRAFSRDDYGWHYLGFNLMKGIGPREETERALRRAVELAPENSWWNGRLVTYLVGEGRPAEAAQEWRKALDRVDPDGTQVAAHPWLAENLHRWVVEAWLNAGRAAVAASVLDQIPEEVIAESEPLQRLKVQVDESNPFLGNEDTSWSAFLSHADERCGVPSESAKALRALWKKLRLIGGAALPIPMAEKGTEYGSIRLDWSYRSATLSIELLPNGLIEWYARDRARGLSTGSEDAVELGSVDLEPWLRRVIDA